VITSYFNVNPNVVTTFLRVHKKTLTQRQYQRDLNVRRTFRQRLYNVIVLARLDQEKRQQLSAKWRGVYWQVDNTCQGGSVRTSIIYFEHNININIHICFELCMICTCALHKLVEWRDRDGVIVIVQTNRKILDLYFIVLYWRFTENKERERSKFWISQEYKSVSTSDFFHLLPSLITSYHLGKSSADEGKKTLRAICAC
jgi:hypothetical protein